MKLPLRSPGTDGLIEATSNDGFCPALLCERRGAAVSDSDCDNRGNAADASATTHTTALIRRIHAPIRQDSRFECDSSHHLSKAKRGGAGRARLLLRVRLDQHLDPNRLGNPPSGRRTNRYAGELGQAIGDRGWRDRP